MASSSRGQGGRGRGSSRGGGRGGFGGGGGQQSQVFQQTGVDTLPSREVRTLEDSVVSGKSQIQGVKQLALEDDISLQHARRPGYGTRGGEVKLWANYVQMTPSKSYTLFKYHVSVSPDVVGRKLGRVVELAMQLEPLSDFKDDLVTDFRSTIISQKELNPDELTVYVKYRLEGEDEPSDKATQYEVRVYHTNTLPVSEFMDHLCSTTKIHLLARSQEITHAFNIFLNHHSRSTTGLTQIGENKTFSFGEQNTWTLGYGLAAARGFFSSVRIATSRLLVNVNVNYGCFYQESRLDELMRQFCGPDYGNKYALGKFIAKLAVRVTHLPPRKNRDNQVIDRIRRHFTLATTIDGRELEHPTKVSQLGAGSSEVQFWFEPQSQAGSAVSAASGPPSARKKAAQASSSSSAGRYITVEAYFRDTYKKRLQHPRAPVINVGTTKRPIYLPPEVCEVLPGQPSRSKLDADQTSEMIKFAVRKPWENAQSIIDQGIGVIGLRAETNKRLGRFGIKVSPQLITVPGRVLDGPKIRYSKSELNPFSGSWNLRDAKFIQPKALPAKKWTGLAISVGGLKNPYDRVKIISLLQTMAGEFEKMGMSAPPGSAAAEITLRDANDTALDDIIGRAAKPLEFLFVILPSRDAVLYNRVKTAGDVKHGLPTVCVIASNILNKDPVQLSQYFANIALKVNLKLGGVNHQLEASRLPLIKEGKTMLVGIDVTHPSAGSASNAPSIAGVVASINPLLGQWPAALRIQEARREPVAELESMFASRLRLWAKHNRTYPDNIVVYRDGVSEGQYEHVLSQELPQLRAAAASLYPASDTKRSLPRITLIVVGKRHHTRFYPTSAESADRGSNCRAGTVVDRGVTLAPNWDFFLQPHAAIQGTARPGHYYVLLDEVFRARYPGSPAPMKPWPAGAQNLADVVEEFTHSLCYLFGRATKAVSLCPPAYYADIVCERARAYCGKVFDSTGVTEVGSSSAGGSGPVVGQEDVEVHPNLRDTMFYI